MREDMGQAKYTAPFRINMPSWWTGSPYITESPKTTAYWSEMEWYNIPDVSLITKIFIDKYMISYAYQQIARIVWLAPGWVERKIKRKILFKKKKKRDM